MVKIGTVVHLWTPFGDTAEIEMRLTSTAGHDHVVNLFMLDKSQDFFR